MVLDGVFERFARQSPFTIMVRAALEHALSPQAIDALFERTARRQYTRTLLFSSVVDLMGAVVAKIQPAVNAAYRAKPEALGVLLRAVYDKLERTGAQGSDFGAEGAGPRGQGPGVGPRGLGPGVRLGVSAQGSGPGVRPRGQTWSGPGVRLCFWSGPGVRLCFWFFSRAKTRGFRGPRAG